MYLLPKFIFGTQTRRALPFSLLFVSAHAHEAEEKKAVMLPEVVVERHYDNRWPRRRASLPDA